MLCKHSLVIFVLLAGLCGSWADPNRRLLVRDIPGRCRNTQQGISWVTDDKGVLCKRQQLDYKSGCCTQGSTHACEGCNLEDKCCTEFEFCVSCCLAPQHGADQLYRNVPRSPKNSNVGFWEDAYEYCAGTCRTHGRSTVHENAYISNRHHCFSKLGKPLLSAPLPAGALDGVEVVVGAPAESCDTACTRAGNRACSQRHFEYLDSCDRLREHVACEAGCETPYGLRLPPQFAAALPSYIDPGAPKQNRPAMCWFGKGTGTCAGRDMHVRRLCPCVARG